MTIAATSLAAALWDRYGRIDAIRRSSRKDAQQMLLMCFCIDNVLSDEERVPTAQPSETKGLIQIASHFGQL